MPGLLIFFLFKISFLFSDNETYINPANNYRAYVKNCYDGDTCTLIFKKRFEATVRLACIDAPEIITPLKGAQPFSEKSKFFLNNLIKSKNVDIHSIGIDKYFRPIVFIHLNGKNINIKMLENGLAEAYRGATKYSKKECFSAELRAKSNKIGIWSLNNYKSPRIFRK